MLTGKVPLSQFDLGNEPTYIKPIGVFLYRLFLPLTFVKKGFLTF